MPRPDRTPPRETPHPRFSIEVKDFGPIQHARLDLRPLTVFMGAGTGKSRLGVLLYAVHRTLGRLGGTGPGGAAAPGRRDPWDEPHDTLARAERETLDAWVDDPTTPPPAWMRDEIARRMTRTGENLFPELMHCFAVPDLADLAPVDADATPAEVVVRACDAKTARAAPEFEWRLAAEAPRCTVTLPRDVPAPAWPRRRPDAYAEEADPVRSVQRALLARLHPPRASEFHLPATRGALLRTYPLIVTTLVRNASERGTRSAPALSGNEADLLSRLAALPSNEGHFAAQAKRIERQLLDGAVQVTRGEGTGMSFYRFRARNARRLLDLHEASSTVAALAPLVVLLRHWMAPDDLLVIEEPEAHLDLTMQLKLVALLASLAADGARVVVSTQSEEILEAVANLVMQARLGEGPLGADDVGVWRFHPTKRHASTVREAHLGAHGMFDAGTQRAMSRLYNESVGLMDRLEQREEAAD